MNKNAVLIKGEARQAGLRKPWAQKEALIFALLIAFFAGMYGFIPGIQVPNLGLWYTTWGTAQSISHQTFPHWFRSTDLLIPYGSPQLGGFLVHWCIAIFINAFSMREDIAGDVTGTICLAVALYAFVRLMIALQVRRWIGYVCGSLFLLMPFVLRHMDYGSMGF